MSLLKRIESARPGSPASPAAPGAPGAPAPAPAGPGPGGNVPTAPAVAPRLMTGGPVRESFRDVKFRIQNRVIQDLDGDIAQVGSVSFNCRTVSSQADLGGLAGSRKHLLSHGFPGDVSSGAQGSGLVGQLKGSFEAFCSGAGSATQGAVIQKQLDLITVRVHLHLENFSLLPLPVPTVTHIGPTP